MPTVSEENAKVAARQAFAREAMTQLNHLYRIAAHLTKNQDQAQDLVQETFVRAIANHEQFSSGTNLKAWLTRILFHFFVDGYQDQKRRTSVHESGRHESELLSQIPADNPGPEKQLLDRELGGHVNAVLNTIPEEFRTPLVLIDMGDFSYQEAAAIMSCPVGTIRSRLSRGRKLMQQRLREYIKGSKPK